MGAYNIDSYTCKCSFVSIYMFMHVYVLQVVYGEDAYWMIYGRNSLNALEKKLECYSIR